MHIVSNVEGKLKPGLDAIAVLRATFPAGTVSGAPKVRAMEIIEELEPSKRGVYAGAVGYVHLLEIGAALRFGAPQKLAHFLFQQLLQPALDRASCVPLHRLVTHS